MIATDTVAGAVFFVAGLILFAGAAISYFAAARWYRKASTEGQERLRRIEELTSHLGHGDHP